LCVVLGHIKFHIISVAIVKRLATIVIWWLIETIVEYQWTVKIKAINFIWGWLAKCDNITVIKIKSTYNAT
jgi:hypothetical protein